jgi:D-alanyl-D-alanine carboxypeptidase
MVHLTGVQQVTSKKPKSKQSLVRDLAIVRRHRESGSYWLVSARVLLAVSTGAALAQPAVAARRPAPVSELVVDVRTGRTLFASNADRIRPPASLAKLMTLLLAFDALNNGRLRLADRLVMTADGERQAPSRLGLTREQTISVSAALRAVAVISANDIAVALADRLSGNEPRFVEMMNRRAAEIGMAHTRFGNATGLAPRAGVTTARDVATLSRFLIQRFPGRYGLFSTRAIEWHGQVRPNHNQLLGKVKGLDGLKTGYTVQAGFNLAASSRRDRKRIVVVVMGAETAAARDLLVANLLESGFTSHVVRSH